MKTDLFFMSLCIMSVDINKKLIIPLCRYIHVVMSLCQQCETEFMFLLCHYAMLFNL